MNQEEKDLAKIGADALLSPVRETVNQIAGPFASEIGGILGDKVRVLRYRLALRLFEKVRSFSLAAGIPLRSVRIKSLLPILESARIEEDEDLHSRWAALLANAAMERTPEMLVPIYVDILRNLSALDAQFLDRVHTCIQSERTDEQHLEDITMGHNVEDFLRLAGSEEIPEQNNFSLANLQRLGLIAEHIRVDFAPERGTNILPIRRVMGLPLSVSVS